MVQRASVDPSCEHVVVDSSDGAAAFLKMNLGSAAALHMFLTRMKGNVGMYRSRDGLQYADTAS